MNHFGCRPERDEDTSVVCGNDVEAATATHPRFPRDRGALFIKRSAVVTRAGYPDLTVFFAITRLRGVPSDVHVPVTVRCDGTTTIQTRMLLDNVALWLKSIARAGESRVKHWSLAI